MKARIREARPEEYGEVAAVITRAYSEFRNDLTPEAWEAYLSDLTAVESRARLARVIVAEGASGILGTVSYFPPGSSPHAEVDASWATVRALAVEPTARGRGVGRMLTMDCIERARSEGAPGLGLMTSSMMKSARSLYESMSFSLLREFEVTKSLCGFVYGLDLTAAPAEPV